MTCFDECLALDFCVEAVQGLRTVPGDCLRGGSRVHHARPPPTGHGWQAYHKLQYAPARPDIHSTPHGTLLSNLGVCFERVDREDEHFGKHPTALQFSDESAVIKGNHEQRSRPYCGRTVAQSKPKKYRHEIPLTIEARAAHERGRTAGRCRANSTRARGNKTDCAMPRFRSQPNNTSSVSGLLQVGERSERTYEIHSRSIYRLLCSRAECSAQSGDSHPRALDGCLHHACRTPERTVGRILPNRPSQVRKLM